MKISESRGLSHSLWSLCIFSRVVILLKKWSCQIFIWHAVLILFSLEQVFVNFIREWRDLQFNVDSERQIFETGRLIYSQNFCQKSAERKSPRKYFFHIPFWCLTLDTNSRFISKKPKHYLLDYDDFIHNLNNRIKSWLWLCVKVGKE